MDARNQQTGSREWSTSLLQVMIDVNRTLGRLEARQDETRALLEYNRDLIIAHIQRFEATTHAKIEMISTTSASHGPSLLGTGLKWAERLQTVLSVVWPILLWLIPRAISVWGLWFSVWEGWWASAWHALQHLARSLLF